MAHLKQNTPIKRLVYMKTKNTTQFLMIVMVLATLLSACTAAQDPAPIATIPAEHTPVADSTTLPDSTQENTGKGDQLTPTEEDMTTINPADLPSALQEVVNQAISTLAEKLSISFNDVLVLNAQSVTWSDSSLGCPQPDMFYLQVLTDGYQIELSVNGQSYFYHANTRGSGMICENPSPPYSDGAVDK